jgi:ferrous iron transport protein B
MPKHYRRRHRHALANMFNGGSSEVNSGEKKVFRVALAGNPNAGKTTIFNAITGQHQHIGNYPGVTVEKKSGWFEVDEIRIELVDLPGTYSLSAYSLEEVVARDFVIDEKPDLIVDVLDASNLERNLYLLLQFQELGVPVVGVLNMIDEAEEQGISVNDKQLGRILGIPLVRTVGYKGVGISELVEMILDVSQGEHDFSNRKVNYGRELESQRELLVEELKTDEEFAANYSVDWLAIKLIENDEDAKQKIRETHKYSVDVLGKATLSRKWVEKHFNDDSQIVVAEQRYAYIHGAIRETVKKQKNSKRIDFTEAFDKIALNRFFGLFIFFGVMFLIYQLTFLLGNPISGWIDSGVGVFGNWLSGMLPDGVFKDLLIDGIIGGVGGVLVFFPLVLFLFMGLSFLEDSGYMARAAFVMDHFFHIFGMHGRSFVPFMIATGCAVPAIMSARTLVNPRDRIITILVTPMMMCSAKSPVIAMLASAFFLKQSALVFWLVWFSGWWIAFLVALLFRKTLFRGEAAPFVMELPPYRKPTINSVLSHMWERSILYVKKAGTFILAASIVIWFLLYFPKMPVENIPTTLQQTEAVSEEVQDSQKSVQLSANDLRQIELTHSYAGRIGKFVEPVLKPFGQDWKMGVGLFAGMAAKEVLISTMGIIYGIGDADPDQESDSHASTPLKEQLKNDPSYTQASVLGLMVFVLIYTPCIAVMAVVKKELGSWKWPLFLGTYTLFVAWVLAVGTYNIASFFGL